MDEALRSLIAFVESASPVVWAAAQQEVTVQIVISTRIVWTFIVLGILCLLLTAFSIYECYDGEDWGLGVFCGLLGIATCFTVVLLTWNYVTALQMNPEYQAIKIIAKLVKGGN